MPPSGSDDLRNEIAHLRSDMKELEDHLDERINDLRDDFTAIGAKQAIAEAAIKGMGDIQKEHAFMLRGDGNGEKGANWKIFALGLRVDEVLKRIGGIENTQEELKKSIAKLPTAVAMSKQRWRTVALVVSQIATVLIALFGKGAIPHP